MIHLTRLNGDGFVLNADMIREIESTPDTVITMTTNQKIVVREPLDDVIDAVIKYKHALFTGAKWGKDRDR